MQGVDGCVMLILQGTSSRQQGCVLGVVALHTGSPAPAACEHAGMIQGEALVPLPFNPPNEPSGAQVELMDKFSPVPMVWVSAGLVLGKPSGPGHVTFHRQIGLIAPNGRIR